MSDFVVWTDSICTFSTHCQRCNKLIRSNWCPESYCRDCINEIVKELGNEEDVLDVVSKEGFLFILYKDGTYKMYPEITQEKVYKLMQAVNKIGKGIAKHMKELLNTIEKRKQCQ